MEGLTCLLVLRARTPLSLNAVLCLVLRDGDSLLGPLKLVIGLLPTFILDLLESIAGENRTSLA
jgi:hypothetical protein